jgi:5-methylcytosine-specific restriction endonuclease McrA
MKQWKLAKKRWRRSNPQPVTGYVCALCGGNIRHTTLKAGRRVNPKALDLTLDHIIPISRIINEGLDPWLLFSETNLQPTHRTCNDHKGASESPDKKYHFRSYDDAELRSLAAKKAHMVQ